MNTKKGIFTGQGLRFRIWLSLYFTLFLVCPLIAQDFQYSLNKFTPLNVNPALVAADKQQDASLIYRSQQIGQAGSLRSSQLNITQPVFFGRNGLAGIGIQLSDDRTGETFFFRKQSFTTALGINLDLGGNKSFSIGLSGGFNSKSINSDGWQTGSQWTGGRFNSALPTGEEIEALNQRSFALNSGIYFRNTDNEGRDRTYFGLSLLHANKPDESFGVSREMPSTFLLHGGVTVWESDVLAFMPQILFTNRAAHNFINIGANLNYSLQQLNSGLLNNNGSIDLGLSYVNEKAAVVGITLHQPNYDLGFSYDIDFNPQTDVRAFRGAPEVALRVYRDLEGKDRVKKSKSKSKNKQKKKSKKKKKKRKSKKRKPASKAKKPVPRTAVAPKKPAPKPAVKPEPDSIVIKEQALEMLRAQQQVREASIKELTSRNVYFDFNFAVLTKEGAAYLAQLAALLQENPQLSISLTGHTDNVGKDDVNNRLSVRRANAVADYLVNLGVDRSRLVVGGKGETSPLVPNSSPENRQLNRRVQVTLVKP